MKIYIDRLRDGHIERIDGEYQQDFISVNENSLSFNAPITAKGEIYLCDDTIVVHFDASTHVTLPCIVCNDPTDVVIAVKDVYVSENISNIRSRVYDFSSELREALLLEAPSFAECNNGSCPHRDDMKKFMVGGRCPPTQSVM